MIKEFVGHPSDFKTQHVAKISGLVNDTHCILQICGMMIINLYYMSYERKFIIDEH